jgi:hypothetical protein
LPTLFEALALWHQAPVRVVLCAADAKSWCRLGLRRYPRLLATRRYDMLLSTTTSSGRGTRWLSRSDGKLTR